MNIGIIGCGGIADRRTIPELIKSTKLKVVAVQDINQKCVENIAEKYKVDSCSTKEDDIISDENVEAVYIATPLHIHTAQIKKAADYGKHVLCEKPLANTLKETEEVIDYCEKKGVILQVGFMMRYHGYHRKAKEMLQLGELGQPVMGRAQLTCWYPPLESAWRQDPLKGGGGALMDMAIHTVDIMRYLFGDVQAVSSFNGSQTHKYAVEDSGVILMWFKNGVYGVCDSFFNIPDEASKGVLEVYGTKGSLLADGTISQIAGGRMVAYLQKEEKGYNAKQNRESIEPIEVKVPLRGMYIAEFEDFLDAVEKKRKPMNSGEEALENFKIIQAAYESQRKREVITIG